MYKMPLITSRKLHLPVLLHGKQNKRGADVYVPHKIFTLILCYNIIQILLLCSCTRKINLTDQQQIDLVKHVSFHPTMRKLAKGLVVFSMNDFH